MACIYQIKNLVNGKFYIGSTQNTFKKRKGEHLTSLRNNYHRNRHLLSSWKKYGEENFKFEIIEDFQFPENYDRDYIYEYVTSRELYYITALNPDYNIARETRGGKLGRKLLEEECIKIGNRSRGRLHTPETIQKIKEARAKQVITEEHKRKISIATKGRVGNKGFKQSDKQKEKARQKLLYDTSIGIGLHSEESKKKRTATLKIKFNTPEMKEVLKKSARSRNKIPFLCFKNGELIGEFLSQADTADLLGLKSSEICAVLRKEQRTTKGYTFNFKNN